MPYLIFPSLVVGVDVARGVTGQREVLLQVRRGGRRELREGKGSMGEGFDVGEDTQTGDGEGLELFEGNFQRGWSVVTVTQLRMVKVDSQVQAVRPPRARSDAGMPLVQLDLGSCR